MSLHTSGHVVAPKSKLFAWVWRCVNVSEDVWMWVKMCRIEDWRFSEKTSSIQVWIEDWRLKWYIWYFELYDVWRSMMCEDLWCVWASMSIYDVFEPKIASSIDWVEEKKVGNRPKNTGWISVDRITQDTLSTYNTWIQISRLQKIYHPHWAKWLFASTPLTASEGRAHRSRSLLIGASQWGWWTTLLSQHGFRLRGVQS